FFEGFEFASSLNGHGRDALRGLPGQENIEKDARVWMLINAYRERAHLLSTTNPIRHRRDRHPHLDLEDFGLTNEDIILKFDSAKLFGFEDGTLGDIINHLQDLYCRSIGVEFMHI